MPETIKIVAVEAKNLYRTGEGLTEDMKKALPKILETTRQTIEQVVR